MSLLAPDLAGDFGMDAHQRGISLVCTALALLACGTVGCQAPVSRTEAAVPTPRLGSPFCSDEKPRRLISQLQRSMLDMDGAAFADTVNPVRGIEIRLFAHGNPARYDRQQAQNLFGSDVVMDWGVAPGSGVETYGTFRELLLPILRDVLIHEYQSSCDRMLVGGATYVAAWPYPDLHFYSLYYSGTGANGNLDWRTLMLGIDYENGLPYLAAIIPFSWEP
jgi:hypothetical protein